MRIFEGDTYPSSKDAITLVVDPAGDKPAKTYLPTIHAGTHYQIGIDATDWYQPIQFTLTIREIAPPRIIANSSQLDSSGKFSARVEGTEGHNYRVTTSIDLITWTPVNEFPAITGEFAFESSAGGNNRFFRVEEF